MHECPELEAIVGSIPKQNELEMVARIDRVTLENCKECFATPVHDITVQKAKLLARALTKKPTINIHHDGRISFVWFDEEIEIVVGVAQSEMFCYKLLE